MSSRRRPGPIITGCSYFTRRSITSFFNNEGRGVWVPAFALWHAHISEAPSCGGGVEVFEAVLHGDGPWGLGRWVAVPAAEPADDPGGPREAVGWVRVSEPFASGFEITIEGGERC